MSKIDIYDDNYNYIGVEDKQVVHRNGIWHRVFTCQIFNSRDNCVYFQKKAPNRYSFSRPDYVDISVGGHYKAGENIEDGIREIYEETGLSDIKFQDLISIGIRQTASTIAENYIANEFQHVYLLDYKGDFSDLLKENEETSGFVKLDIDDVLNLLICQKTSIKGEFAFLRDKTVTVESVDITLNDFVPSYLRVDQFMLRLIVAIQRYMDDLQSNKKRLLFL